MISSFISSYSFSTLRIKTNSSWLIIESINALEIKNSMLFNSNFFLTRLFCHVFFLFLNYWLILFSSCCYCTNFQYYFRTRNYYKNVNQTSKRKIFELTKYPQKECLTYDLPCEKKMRIHEILTRRNFERTKCLRGKTSDPQITHEDTTTQLHNAHESYNGMESTKFSKLNRKPLRILLVGSHITIRGWEIFSIPFL